MQGNLQSDCGHVAIVVMGVCGVGKSRIASTLSEQLSIGLIEADDHHSPENKAKMSGGIALTDVDRTPWLEAVGLAAREKIASSGGVVVACSSLKKIYRDQLRSLLPGCHFLHLTGPRELIKERLDQRRGHFVGETLLDSQLATLEPLNEDEDGFTLPISMPVEGLIDSALEKLRHVVPPSQTLAS